MLMLLIVNCVNEDVLECLCPYNVLINVLHFTHRQIVLNIYFETYSCFLSPVSPSFVFQSTISIAYARVRSTWICISKWNGSIMSTWEICRPSRGSHRNIPCRYSFVPSPHLCRYSWSAPSRHVSALSSLLLSCLVLLYIQVVSVAQVILCHFSFSLSALFLHSTLIQLLNNFVITTFLVTYSGHIMDSESIHW